MVISVCLTFFHLGRRKYFLYLHCVHAINNDQGAVEPNFGRYLPSAGPPPQFGLSEKRAVHLKFEYSARHQRGETHYFPHSPKDDYRNDDG